MAVVANAYKKEIAKVNGLLSDYWSLIDEITDITWETKENSRGQKRRLPATEQLAKITKVSRGHSGKRAKQVVSALFASGAGGSTDAMQVVRALFTGGAGSSTD